MKSTIVFSSEHSTSLKTPAQHALAPDAAPLRCAPPLMRSVMLSVPGLQVVNAVGEGALEAVGIDG